MIGDLRRHLRFLMAFGLGLVAGMLAFRMAWLDRLLIFADVFCLAYLVLVALMMRRMTVRDLHRHADDDDEGMRLIVPLAVGVVVLSLFAIHMTLRDPSGGFSLRPALAILSVPLGWAMIHTVMAFHYARMFYTPDRDAAAGWRGAWSFPARARANWPGSGISSITASPWG